MSIDHRNLFNSKLHLPLMSHGHGSLNNQRIHNKLIPHIDRALLGCNWLLNNSNLEAKQMEIENELNSHVSCSGAEIRIAKINLVNVSTLSHWRCELVAGWKQEGLDCLAASINHRPGVAVKNAFPCQSDERVSWLILTLTRFPFFLRLHCFKCKVEDRLIDAVRFRCAQLSSASGNFPNGRT